MLRSLVLLLSLLTVSLCRAADEAPEGESSQPTPQWIWLNEDGKPAQTVFLRREFEIRGLVSTARLYATCDNAMKVYLDGKLILEHDHWENPVFKDVAEAFAVEPPDGRHVLAVEAENHGDNPAGFVLQLDFESGWRDPWSIVTDDSWRVSERPARSWRRVDFPDDNWPQADVVAPLGGGPWGRVTAASFAAAARLREPTATSLDAIKSLEGFEVELLHSVPKDTQGSWVNMCVDPRGRLIVTDQYGGLFRVTPPPIDGGSRDAEGQAELKIEKIDVDLGEAQGLLWAFDSLYVMVNRGQRYDSGLYRVRDTDGDDQLDTVDVLRKLDGGGEHGPHAIMLTPDGESLIVVCGNGTRLTDVDVSRVPRVWDEDLLLPRVYGRGFMRDAPAPGGYICRVDPDGKNWELIATGFRNQYDAALNADGELFAYDADMEWDMNTPWYRPTRVCHVVSGAEFGWRNGSGKWPEYYPDSVPPVVNIGPGSPTGVCFGHGAKFPAKYQGALFLNDWTYGKLHAVHLKPQGASYTAEFEEFVSGTPLPLTDVVINPRDGAMYFAIGGRRVQSGLYRVTYTGDESTAAADLHQPQGAEARATRQRLEALHVGDHPGAVDVAWPYLSHDDSSLRYAARVAIEHRPLDEWRSRALEESDPRAAITALIALARRIERPTLGDVLDAPPPVYPADDAARHALQPQVLEALARIDWSGLTNDQRVDLLRAYTLAFVRLGPPTEAAREALIAKFDAIYPAQTPKLNVELARILVYLEAPSAAPKTLAVLAGAPTQEEQIDYAAALRHLDAGWTPELREEYFGWFVKAAGFRGGASFTLFVDQIKADAVAMLSDDERLALQPILDRKPEGPVTAVAAEPRPLVKVWSLDELSAMLAEGLHGRDFENGRQMFAAANCFACHRFDNQGGAIGPDLTLLSGRFSPRDVLESIAAPSKVISDQYQAVTVLTADGKVITGRIVNFAGDSFTLNTDMLAPDAQVSVDRKQIEEMAPSKVSMMPEGLLNTLTGDEILDLMAYLLSRGDPDHAMFQ